VTTPRDRIALSKLTYEQIMAAVGQFKGKIKRQQPKDQSRQWR